MYLHGNGLRLQSLFSIVTFSFVVTWRNWGELFSRDFIYNVVQFVSLWIRFSVCNFTKIRYKILVSLFPENLTLSIFHNYQLILFSGTSHINIPSKQLQNVQHSDKDPPPPTHTHTYRKIAFAGNTVWLIAPWWNFNYVICSGPGEKLKPGCRCGVYSW